MDNPKILKHTTAHHHRQWLDTVYDLPQKAKGVEIYNCFEYERMRLHWNGCGLILHELCHLIHQLVLPDGLDNRTVLDAFGNALESGLYDEVLRRDWAYEEEEMDAAYATINHKEFFAEMSVAFWSRGYDALCPWWWKRMMMSAHWNGRSRLLGRDYDHDHCHEYQNMQQCSPPFMSPEVLERGQAVGHHVHDDDNDNDDDGMILQNHHNHDMEGCWMQGLVEKFGSSRGCHGGKRYRGHCNKFFPFTHGQLKRYDPETFAVFQQLWNEISQWKDPWQGKSDKNEHQENLYPKCDDENGNVCWWTLPHGYFWNHKVKDIFQKQQNADDQNDYNVEKDNVLNVTVDESNHGSDSVGSDS